MIIGLYGRTGSGKNAFADQLVDRHDYVKLDSAGAVMLHARVAEANIVIPSVTTTEEIHWIHDHGGYIVEIFRPGLAQPGDAGVRLDRRFVDFVFWNVGDMDGLHAAVDYIANWRLLS